MVRLLGRWSWSSRAVSSGLAAADDALDRRRGKGAERPTSDTDARRATATLAEVLEVSSGALDNTLGGIEAGRLTLIAGPPAASGSLLAGVAACRAAIEEERGVHYLASGVSPADLAWRWTSRTHTRTTAQ